MPASNPPFVTEIRRYGTAAIEAAAVLIEQGQPVAVPTETVYGLAADATNGAAVAAIYAAKGRPSFNPLIVHVADLAAAEQLAVFDETARTLAKAFWPGPLTLVLERRPDCSVASLATAGLPTIALRCPAHPAMQALLAASARPLAAPSANASGAISPTRAAHVLKSLAGRIPLVIDAGPTEIGLESTIVALEPLSATEDHPNPSIPSEVEGRTWPGRVRLLRPGPVTPAMFEALGLSVNDAATTAIEAPGQLASHYSPAKPLRLNASEAEPDEWLIGFGAVAGDATLSEAGDLAEAAARLFDLLHEADAADRPRIAIAPIPHHGLGIAINDRLARAAASD